MSRDIYLNKILIGQFLVLLYKLRLADTDISDNPTPNRLSFNNSSQIIWISGEEKVETVALSTTMQKLLLKYVVL